MDTIFWEEDDPLDIAMQNIFASMNPYYLHYIVLLWKRLLSELLLL